MLDNTILSRILSNFGLPFDGVSQSYDTSHGAEDRRWNYILDQRYVLKVNSVCSMWEQRLQEIRRLTERYRAIGVYCPGLIPTLAGPLSCLWEIEGKPCTCYVEEYAKYPLCGEDVHPDRKEVVAHLGVLAARYSGVDLSETRSMWSILDLAPLDVDIDEKQENTNILVNALIESGFPALAKELDGFNEELRAVIRKDYKTLPRCVYQGDLNNSNLLHRDGHFAGLIDFNMSGTDVNINVFVNETNCFPETGEFDTMAVPEILSGMDSAQDSLLSVIFESYPMNNLEKRLFPYYRRICSLFQYPNVCAMGSWLKDSARRDKCAALIRALINKPL